jgi:hypothetical protein
LDRDTQAEIFRAYGERLIADCLADYSLLTREEVVEILKAFGRL